MVDVIQAASAVYILFLLLYILWFALRKAWTGDWGMESKKLTGWPAALAYAALWVCVATTLVAAS